MGGNLPLSTQHGRLTRGLVGPSTDRTADSPPAPAHALGVFQHTDAHAQALGFSGIPDLLENLGQDIELQAAELRLIGP